mmetsp:Transcript_45963/g.144174  ORF Transcript_45963/g.144174 Transcript_45963/m.144174 type:complete len:512 (-) Transcript_45963:4421-5956(-)
MPDRRGGAVGSRVSASDHDHTLSTDIDEAAVVLELPVLVALVRGPEGDGVGHELRVLAKQGLLLLAQELHGKVDVLEIPARDRKVSWLRGSHGEQDSIKLALELICSHVLADFDVADEVDSFGLHDLEPPLNHSLVQLHVGDAKHEKPSWFGVTLEHSDLVSHLVQLIRSCQACWTRADDRHGESSAILGDPGLDPSFLETTIDDRVLDVLDRHWRSDQSGNAGTLARRRANSSGELREVVGGKETIKSGLPLLLEDKLVPLRHEVVDWATRVSLTEWGTAVHAPRCLALSFSIVSLNRSVDLSPVRETLRWLTVGFRDALDLHEPTELIELGCDLLLARRVSLNLNLLSVHINLQVLLLVALFATLPRVSVRSLLPCSLVVKGEDLNELLSLHLPVVQDRFGNGRSSSCKMFLDVADEFLLVDIAFQTLEVPHGLCEVCLVPELTLGIIYPSNSTTHSSRKVLANFSQNDGSASGHVLKSMIATALDDSDGSGVTDCEPFGCDTSEECPP